ncbi:MAG: peptidase C45, partial [Bacteroidetes bacterium]|nr:peptidase C45 [Bacteroidota bacterium]
PSNIGYQQGYLAANEIDTVLQMFSYFLSHSTKRDWNFYRSAAQRFFWNKLDTEYKEEIKGIAEGLQAKSKHYDSLDILALNGWTELASYYVPQLDDKILAGSGNNKAPGNCSAFIATGSYTKDGKIVMGHNTWLDYIVGEHSNMIDDIVPEHGNRIFMDSYPGTIQSGDDFLITDKGILITETTITGFKGFDSTRAPEFMRARKAAQYSNSIDDVVRIFTTDNNGAYANDWLIGDIKTNEVAKLELGLKNYKVWRSKDTAMVGSNFPSDEKLIKEETNFDVKDMSYSSNGRKLRFEGLIQINKGKIDAETGKTMEADHYDAVKGEVIKDRCVICGHIDEDKHGAPEFALSSYYPAGSVQGKVTTADLAKNMQFWAHMGHPCGESFNADAFFKQHPEYTWQSKYLRNMNAYPWTLFSAKK